MTKNATLATAFSKEVHEGLTAYPKYLSSKYFYDAAGDKLFQKIMGLPEYYLTGKEYDILNENSKAIVEQFSSKTGFDLIELGAGDGKKTKLLLAELQQQQKSFKYKPIDISPHVLRELEASVKKDWPEIEVHIQEGSYFEVLKDIDRSSDRKKVILFLGSNIGNLPHEKAVAFLKEIRKSMSAEDLLLAGFDKKKNPKLILNAYNDSQGVTQDFNLNILRRINRELQADFDLDQFMHWPTYDPETGTAKSYLVSTQEQDVHLDALGLDIHFEAFESINTEISQKYDDATVEWLAKESGLCITEAYSDGDGHFTNYIFKNSNL
ncbi:MAG: L-histidine N(alpha)-methyltransferase [Leeuwenhoekiella sp.]